MTKGYNKTENRRIISLAVLAIDKPFSMEDLYLMFETKYNIANREDIDFVVEALANVGFIRYGEVRDGVWSYSVRTPA